LASRPLKRTSMVDRSIIGADPAFCVEDIQKADFVALRVDISDEAFNNTPDPVKSRTSKVMTMEEYFKAHVQQMERPPQHALPQRLGICCGIWQPFDRCFQLSSYDIAIFPGLPGTQHPAVRRFMTNKVRTKNANWQEYMSAAMVMVLKALQEAKCPILVYDGLTDVLQLFDKFLGPVASQEMCFETWLQHFPAIYDVKWMALQDLPGEVMMPPGLKRWRCDPQQALLGLWKGLYSTPAEGGRRPKRFREVGPFDFRAQAVISLKKPCGYEGEGYMGRMAMMIAEIFVLLNDYRMPPMKKEDLKPSKVTKKRRRELTKKFAEVDSTTLPSSADELHEVTPSTSQSSTLNEARRKRKRDADDTFPPSPCTPTPDGADDLTNSLPRKRPRCMARLRDIESVVDGLARNLVNQRTEEDIDITDVYGMELLERCAFNCRFFRNVLNATGTAQGHVTLDASLVAGAALEYENMEDL